MTEEQVLTMMRHNDIIVWTIGPLSLSNKGRWNRPCAPGQGIMTEERTLIYSRHSRMHYDIIVRIVGPFARKSLQSMPFGSAGQLGSFARKDCVFVVEGTNSLWAGPVGPAVTFVFPQKKLLRFLPCCFKVLRNRTVERPWRLRILNKLA